MTYFLILQALNRLSEGMSHGTDEYLDVTLIEEEDILTEYKRNLDM